MFRHLVLGLLRRGEPRHGYALMKEYRVRTGLQLSTGNFYRELQRLTRAGLVRSTSRGAAEDPRRSPYTITDGGERIFDGWLQAPPRELIGCCDDELSARALFLDFTAPNDAARMITSWKEDLWLTSKRFERMRESALATSRRNSDSGARIRATLLARRLRHVAADLAFLEELCAELERSAAAMPTATGATLKKRARPDARAPRRGMRAARSVAREIPLESTCAENDEDSSRTRKARRRQAP